VPVYVDSKGRDIPTERTYEAVVVVDNHRAAAQDYEAAPAPRPALQAQRPGGRRRAAQGNGLRARRGSPRPALLAPRALHPADDGAVDGGDVVAGQPAGGRFDGARL
jgi:hypothetical protein